MNSILFGNGYWANIVKKKIIGLTNLVAVVDSNTSYNLGNIDIAFICSSTDSHYHIIKDCLDSNIKYLFCTKPFTGNYDKAKELFDKATQKGISIFVDNLFLFRKEIMNIEARDMRNIHFYWEKTNTRENLIDSLLYHDLYLLLKWSRSNKWEVTYKHISDNALLLFIDNHYQKCCFEYRIDCINEKVIRIDDHTIYLSTPQNDPLNECITHILDDSIDYDLSKKVTLDTLRLMDNIKKQL